VFIIRKRLEEWIIENRFSYLANYKGIFGVLVRVRRGAETKKYLARMGFLQ